MIKDKKIKKRTLITGWEAQFHLDWAQTPFEADHGQVLLQDYSYRRGLSESNMSVNNASHLINQQGYSKLWQCFVPEYYVSAHEGI